MMNYPIREPSRSTCYVNTGCMQTNVAVPTTTPDIKTGGVSTWDDPAPRGGSRQVQVVRLSSVAPLAAADRNQDPHVDGKYTRVTSPQGQVFCDHEKTQPEALRHSSSPESSLCLNKGDIGGGDPQIRLGKDKKTPPRRAEEEHGGRAPSSGRRNAGGGDLGPSPQARPRVGKAAEHRRRQLYKGEFLRRSRFERGREPQ